MRGLPYIVVAVGLMGCKPDCGSPNQLDGQVYSMFGNVVDYETGATGAPPGMTLVNGATDFSMTWGAAPVGPVTVQLNGQEFGGEGVWQEVECGNFALSFGGTFVSDDGTSHNFSAAGNFLFYDDTLEASLAWNETWSSSDGIGTLDAPDAAATGTRTP